MKALYVEPFAGISGNMLLGALLDAGVPFAFLQEEFAVLAGRICQASSGKL